MCVKIKLIESVIEPARELLNGKITEEVFFDKTSQSPKILVEEICGNSESKFSAKGFISIVKVAQGLTTWPKSVVGALNTLSRKIISEVSSQTMQHLQESKDISVKQKRLLERELTTLIPRSNDYPELAQLHDFVAQQLQPTYKR